MFKFISKKIERLKNSFQKRKERRFEKIYEKVKSQCETYSQSGQDLFVQAYFEARPKKAKYFFVDIGANDGVTFSNSYALERSKFQHWGGGH